MPRALSLADFLGSLVTCAVGSPRGDRRTVRFGSEGGFACPPHNLRPSTCNSVCRRHFHCSVSTIAARASDGILTVSSIGLGFRLILRSRLTLNRLALFRKPWSFGGGASHPPCRYLFLHLPFRTLQSGSRRAFYAERNAPLPIHTGFHGFGRSLIPDYYPCPAPRLVSCYALFE